MVAFHDGVRAFVLSGLSMTAFPSWAQAPSITPTPQPTDAEEEIVVTGQRLGAPEETFGGGQVARGGRVGILGNQDVFDTPFSQTNYTEKLLRDQQAQTIADVVQNDSSVRNISASGAPQHDFFIRGFRADTDDIALNGLYGIAPQNRAAIEGIERVEILRGPTSLLNGVPPQGGIGGTINLVPKRATDAPISRGELRYASDAQFGGHVDVGRRFGPDKAFGVRANGAYRDGELGVDDNAVRFGVATLGLDYGGPTLRASIDVGGHEEKIRGINADRSVAAGVVIPKAPSNRTNLNQSWEFQDSNHRFANGRIEFDVTDAFTIFGGGGLSEFRALNLGGGAEIIGSDGEFSQGVFLVPIDIDRETAEVGFRAKFTTGGLDHTVNVSALTLTGTTGFNFSFVNFLESSNIYAPVRIPRPDTTGLPTNAVKAFGFRNRGLAGADTISALDGRVALTIGGRLQEVRSSSFDGETGARTDDYKESKFSPAFAVLVKPIERLSVYANYAQGLQQGQVAQAPAVNAGEIFPPFVSKQYEVGAKYDFGAFGISAALFQITQPSSFDAPVEGGQTRFVVDGEQRNRGAEISLFGEPAPGFRVLGGVTYLRGELTRTGDVDGDGLAGDEDGNEAPGVPEVQVNLYGEYDLSFVPRLTLTGRVVHTSSQFYDRANLQSIPNWTRVDIGARYRIDVGETALTLRANLNNVAGNNYYQSAANGSLTQGDPRTVLLSASVEF